MSSFSPTPRAIFEAAATASGITRAELRNFKNPSPEAAQTRDLVFTLTALWTPCAPAIVPALMSMKNVSEDVVREGISEGAKGLFYDVAEIFDALMYEDNRFDYHDRSSRDAQIGNRICEIFGNTPGSGYVIAKHGPIAQAEKMLREGLMTIDESDFGMKRIRIAEGAILKLAAKME